MKAWHTEARRLRDEGLSYREIGARLGRGRSSVSYALSVEPSTTYRGARAGMTAADRDRRREAVRALRRLGWSARRIALTLGMSDSAVRRDLAALGESGPAVVVGRDGRRWAARRRPPR